MIQWQEWFIEYVKVIIWPKAEILLIRNLQTNLSVKSSAKFMHFRSWNSFENVVSEMDAIVFRPQCDRCV